MTAASPSRSVLMIAWGMLGVVLVAVVVMFARSQASRSNLPEYNKVQPFSLTNQVGQRVSAADLRGRVWVADIIFTRCAGPCPRMTEEMSKLQNAFSERDRLAFVTLTTDPDYDTPAVLKKYAAKFGAQPERWHFLTGTKPQIRDVAIKSLLLAAVEKGEEERDNPSDLFIHSTTFVLIDKRGVMRGVYESLEPGFQEKIRADIQELLREDG